MTAEINPAIRLYIKSIYFSYFSLQKFEHDSASGNGYIKYSQRRTGKFAETMEWLRNSNACIIKYNLPTELELTLSRTLGTNLMKSVNIGKCIDPI